MQVCWEGRSEGWEGCVQRMQLRLCQRLYSPLTSSPLGSSSVSAQSALLSRTKSAHSGFDTRYNDHSYTDHSYNDHTSRQTQLHHDSIRLTLR